MEHDDIRSILESLLFVADDPLTAVVMGAGKALDELSLLKELAIQ